MDFLYYDLFLRKGDRLFNKIMLCHPRKEQDVNTPPRWDVFYCNEGYAVTEEVAKEVLSKIQWNRLLPVSKFHSSGTMDVVAKSTIPKFNILGFTRQLQWMASKKDVKDRLDRNLFLEDEAKIGILPPFSVKYKEENLCYQYAKTLRDFYVPDFVMKFKTISPCTYCPFKGGCGSLKVFMDSEGTDLTSLQKFIDSEMELAHYTNPSSVDTSLYNKNILFQKKLLDDFLNASKESRPDVFAILKEHLCKHAYFQQHLIPSLHFSKSDQKEYKEEPYDNTELSKYCKACPLSCSNADRETGCICGKRSYLKLSFTAPTEKEREVFFELFKDSMKVKPHVVSE